MDKRILLPLVILPAFQTGNMQAADQPAKRPNIILFMVDDMEIGRASCSERV